MLATGSIFAHRAPIDGKDGLPGADGAPGAKGDTGLTGLSIRNTEWVAGVYYRNDTSLTGTERYLDFAIIVGSGDFQDGVGTNYSIYQAKTAHNGVISSATNKPGSGASWGTYWEKINVLKPVFTPILLASLIKASQIEVDNVIANGIFGRELDVENAILHNLTVDRLGTTANPYADRLANIGSSIGVFKNQADESDIFNAMVGIGKDISKTAATGEKKPAVCIRDVQWKGNYSSSTIYYKDDRVYYSSKLGATSWSSSDTYNTGAYVTYSNTVWVCTANNSGNKPYVDSPYWNAHGGTYIFTKEWLATDTISSGLLPTNVSYWQYIGSGNLGGGQYSELGSEGLFVNGSNITGVSVYTGIISNFSGAFILNKRNTDSGGVSAAVYGSDNTTSGASRSYGGYFNSAYIGRVVHNIRKVSESGAILKSDYRIHCYGSSSITLTLPTPDNSMVGQTIKIRRLGTGNVIITTSSSYPIWDTSSMLSITFSNDDALSFTWDGGYWVTEFTNQ